MHHVTAGKPLYLCVEGVVWLDVLECLPYRWLYEPCSVRYDLGRLPTSGVREGVEVWSAWGYAGVWSWSWVAIIPTHVSPGGKPLYPLVEGVGGGYILEGLSGDWLREASGIGDHLG